MGSPPAQPSIAPERSSPGASGRGETAERRAARGGALHAAQTRGLRPLLKVQGIARSAIISKGIFPAEILLSELFIT